MSVKDGDNVNHPRHYNVGKFEVIDVIEDWNLGFNTGNAVKYIARAKHKEKELEDLEKAAWYLNREIENLKKVTLTVNMDTPAHAPINAVEFMLNRPTSVAPIVDTLTAKYPLKKQVYKQGILCTVMSCYYSNMLRTWLYELQAVETGSVFKEVQEKDIKVG